MIDKWEHEGGKWIKEKTRTSCKNKRYMCLSEELRGTLTKFSNLNKDTFLVLRVGD